MYERRICLERKLSKEVLKFEEVVRLLKEVYVTDKENLMISYTGDDGCFPLVNNIISWVSKEKINITLSSDEAE